MTFARAAYSESDLFRKRVDMQNARISRADDVFRLDDTEIRLERGDRFDGFRDRCEDESGCNVFIGHAAEPQTDVVTAESLIQLLCLFGVNAGHLDATLYPFSAPADDKSDQTYLVRHHE